MSDYKTGNPVPSIDPMDLDDNATILDKLLNQAVASVLDRLGVPRKTYWQMEQDASAILSPNVSALAALVGQADRGIRFTGAGALALYTQTAFFRTLADDADASAARATLGVVNAGPGYIDGLLPSWNSASSITISAGSAYIPGTSKVLVLPAPVTLSSLTLTASTWYYLYLYDNAGTPAVELSTTAPSATYSGRSRTKTADTSRRFIGALRSNAGTGLWNFEVDTTGYLQYREVTSVAPFRVITNGTATVSTSVSLAAVVPTTTKTALLNINNLATTAVLSVSNSESSGVIAAFSKGLLHRAFPTNAAQAITYLNDTTGATYIDVAGYGMDR